MCDSSRRTNRQGIVTEPRARVCGPDSIGIADGGMRADMRRAFNVLTILSLLTLAGQCVAGEWPGWRGPTGQGLSEEADVPLKWSPTENVRWKVKLPAPGNS